MNESYALVLGGGGANGSYEIGVWKALRELNIKITAVFGNSVGALNSAMVIQNDLEKAINLWKIISIDKIVKIPPQLVKDGKLNININNLTHMKELQKSYFENRGLDTSPLKKLLHEYVSEERIRSKHLDFGVVTYMVSDFRPIQIYIDEIPRGLLIDYLLASASIPLIFKNTEIKGKRFADGGVYDNLPYRMAKYRGYKNIIVVDISGLGINRRPNIIGTRTVYIKNSSELGNILDFIPEQARQYMKLGYLDTLKIFEQLIGIKYFYKYDKKTISLLHEILFDPETIREYVDLICKNEIECNAITIKGYIKRKLPRKVRNYKYLVLSLMECAATGLDIEVNRQYRLKELLDIIWEKYMIIEKEISKDAIENYKNIFEFLSAKTEKIKINTDLKDFFVKASYKYEKLFSVIFQENKKIRHTKILSNFFPNLIGANLFFIVLKKYMARKKTLFDSW